jgi:hypothetical protein
MEKGRILIGLSLTLVGYAFLSKDPWRTALLVVVLLLAMFALLVLRSEKLPRKLKQHVEQIAQNLDIGWTALGLGFFGTGIKCIQNSTGSIHLLFLGAVLLLAGGPCIGLALGTAGIQLLDKSARTSIFSGWVAFVAGAGWLVFALIMGRQADKTWLVLINEITPQIVIISFGLMLIYFGNRKLRIRRESFHADDLAWDADAQDKRSDDD